MIRICAWFLFASCLSASGERVYTSPRGFYTVHVPGAAQPGETSRTYLGVQFPRSIRFQGNVASLDGHKVVLNTFVGSILDVEDPVRPSYLHVMNGFGRGFVTDIVAFHADGVVCAEDPSPWMAAGVNVKIRPHANVADVFTADNRYGLAAGPDAANADNLVVWDAASQQEIVYFFHETRNRWERDGVEADAGTDSIRFPHGCYLVRRSTGTIRILLTGDEIATDTVLLPVRTGQQVFSLPINLSGSPGAIVRVFGDYAVKSGPNAASSDVLVFEEPATGQRRGPFYHMRRGGDEGWREVGVDDSDAASQPLDFLSTLVFHRRGAPGRVLVEASLDPPAIPRPPLPADPDPGETPLTGEFQFSLAALPDVIVTIETSTDLLTWTAHATPQIDPDGRCTFPLPAGQGRAFYRLGVELNF